MRLFNGQTTVEIAEWLNTLDEAKRLIVEKFAGIAFNRANVESFRRRIYPKWLAEWENLQKTRQVGDLALELAQSAKNGVAGGATTLIAVRIFSLLKEQVSSLSLDTLSELVSSIVTLRRSEQEDKRLDLDLKRMAQKDRQLDLEEAKFQRLTCEKIIQFCVDARVAEIATLDIPQPEKVKALGPIIFGEDWKTDDMFSLSNRP